VKFVYFDVGGVLVKDFSKTDKWEELFREWGVSEERWTELSTRYDTFEDEVNIGGNVEEFVSILRGEFGVVLPKDYSLLMDFVDRFFINQGLNELVLKIKNKYRLGLLTNMYPGMLDLIRERNLIPNIDWEIIVDSSIVKCKKPEEEIYKIAEKKTGVEPQEILFIDNTAENLIVPVKRGWQVFSFSSADYEGSNRRLTEFFENERYDCF